MTASICRAAERAQACLKSIGFHGSGLKRRVDTLCSCFDGGESTPWEEGVTLLGRLLGFEASHPGGHGDPDSVWLADGSLAIAWEIKSEESPDGEIGTRTVQQARGHEAWARANLEVDEDATVLSVLVSDRGRLAGGAEVHAGELCIVGLDKVRDIAEATLAALQRVRAQGRDADDTRSWVRRTGPEDRPSPGYSRLSNFHVVWIESIQNASWPPC